MLFINIINNLDVIMDLCLQVKYYNLMREMYCKPTNTITKGNYNSEKSYYYISEYIIEHDTLLCSLPNMITSEALLGLLVGIHNLRYLRPEAYMAHAVTMNFSVCQPLRSCLAAWVFQDLFVLRYYGQCGAEMSVTDIASMRHIICYVC